MESIEVYKPSGTFEEDFVNLVKLELNDIRNTFFKIGFRLNEARNNAYYRKLGYSSIEECAEALFGFKRTTTYDLMAVASRFCDSKAPMLLAESYRKYNQNKNRTEVKNMLQAVVSNKVRSFDYEIILCSRKQPVNAFCGNVSNWILDTILEDYFNKQKEYAESKKKGRKK